MSRVTFVDISMENFSCVLMHINTLEGVNKTDVAAVAEIVFTTDPESRIALWYAKGLDGKFAFQTSVHPIEVRGQLVNVPAFTGKIANDLVTIAQTAQGKIKAKFGSPKAGSSYKITRDSVEEVHEG